jgi:hypothetical protein
MTRSIFVVNELFEQILEKGYACTQVYHPYWKENLPERYHHFGGQQIFQFLSTSFPVELCLAPPCREGRKVRADPIYERCR